MSRLRRTGEADDATPVLDAGSIFAEENRRSHVTGFFDLAVSIALG